VRYWLDTEFIERPCTIDLISIGIVGDGSRSFYGENSEVDWSQASPWVLENVRPYLWAPKYPHADFAIPREELASRILAFIGPGEPEFWGYYADYDWVAFCWLFGTMMDLPKGWPKYCRDIKQWADDLGNPKLPEQTSTEHNALADARWNREAWEFLRDRSEDLKAFAEDRPDI
jgi:hypothetical protein